MESQLELRDGLHEQVEKFVQAMPSLMAAVRALSDEAYKQPYHSTLGKRYTIRIIWCGI